MGRRYRLLEASSDLLVAIVAKILSCFVLHIDTAKEHLLVGSCIEAFDIVVG